MRTQAISLRMDKPRRRLSAVWFADIVGYTELSSRDEPAALALVQELQALAREIVEREFEGRIVKFIGDAILAEFDSTESAVRAAVALQERYAVAAESQGQPSQLHTGVHLGEVTATADGDLYGDGINTAARLQQEATAGQIIISEDVWRQLRQRPEFSFASLGAVELRGITSQVQVFDVLFGARAALAGQSEPPSPPDRHVSGGAVRRRALVAGAAAILGLVLLVVLLVRTSDPTGTVGQPAPTDPTGRRDEVVGATGNAREPASGSETRGTPTPVESPAAEASSSRATGPLEESPGERGARAGDPDVTEEGTAARAGEQVGRQPDPSALLAVRGLLEEFAAALGARDPGPQLRRLYPGASLRQSLLFRGIRQQMGPNVRTRLAAVEPIGVSGDTLAIRFAVLASGAGRTQTIPFEAKVVGSPAGPRFAELIRSRLRP